METEKKNYRFAEAEEILRTLLDPDDYAASWEEGRSFALEEGIAMATEIARNWEKKA